MKKNTKTFDSILDRLDELIGDVQRPIQPDEFTGRQYLERILEKGGKMSERTAWKRLDDMVKKGILTKRKTIDKSLSVTVFKIVKP